MRLIFDATALKLYPVGKEGFHGGTEGMVKHIAHGLAERGHTVHVVAPDLDSEEQRGPTEFWWPQDNHPTTADAVVMVHNLANVYAYSADILVLASNGVDPDLGPDGDMAEGIDAFPCFSQAHIDLLREFRPSVSAEKCFLTGLGVDLPRETGPKRPGRLLYANNPANGLWHVLDIFDHLKRQVSYASLHVAYDFNRQFEPRRWEATAMAEMLWECKKRLEITPDVKSLGALSRDELVREQLECAVHAMPQDSENPSTTIWSLTAMECAAAGAALVLSDQPGYREVFGEAAEILPVSGTFVPSAERRVDAQDWSEVIAGLMQDDAKMAEASRKARALAEQHTWGRVVTRWEDMLVACAKKVGAYA